jgi:dATP pyrophosphohydrolase
MVLKFRIRKEKFMPTYKQAQSVLVLIHSPDLDILLLERADHPEFWQSVTGSLEPHETPAQAAVREVFEETGLREGLEDKNWVDWHRCVEYDIFKQWRHRYPPGTLKNTEHHFSLEVKRDTPILIEPREHLSYAWYSWKQAAEKVFSPSNRQIILELAQYRKVIS